MTTPAILAAATMVCQVQSITDGDTLRACGERIRLLGIDSPEMPGHCARNRHCAPGDPYAARDALTRAAGTKVTVQPIKRDRYGRMVAVVSSHGLNLSCEQLRRGHAIYRAKWDDGSRIRKACPEVAR